MEKLLLGEELDKDVSKRHLFALLPVLNHSSAQVYDVMLILRSHATVQSLFQLPVFLGGDLSVSSGSSSPRVAPDLRAHLLPHAGPVGNGMMLEEEMQAAAIWVYAKNKALYQPLRLEDAVLEQRADDNSYEAFARSSPCSR